MTTSPATPGARLVAAAARVAEALVGGELTATLTALGDDALLALLADTAQARHAVDLVAGAASAEVAKRSARELGYSGLAQRKGHRNATSLVQNITGESRADVTRAVRTGEELGVPVGPPTVDEPTPVVPRWLDALRGALAGGRLGSAQFHAIRAGLGEPPVERYPALDPAFLPGAWAVAVEQLVAEASTLPVEELRSAARIARDRLDPIGVTLRFEERFEKRSFRTWTDESGQQHARIVFDDEAAAWVHAMLQAALRPRRGPRFVDADAARKTREAEADPRSNEQLQYDTLIAVLRTGANADPRQAFGDRQPGVRIVVEQAAIAAAGTQGEMRVTGVGHLEDGGQALPGGVIEKFLCDAGAIPIHHDEHGRPLDLGREARLFTAKQRIAITTRDGGCIWPSCIAPPSQCELHHLDHWWEHHGKTDVDDGVPLCRNCHMRLHNQGWRIRRERDAVSGADTYWLHPPPDAETAELGEPVRLTSKSPRRFAAA
ncbi:MAG: DUF222 domain-containing protein [Microbacterium sp.]